jgi:hypothetical protein
VRARIAFYYPGCWACYVVRRYGVVIRLVSFRPDARRGRLHELVEITGDRSGIEQTLKFLRGYSHIAGHRLLSVSDGGARVRMQVDAYMARCPLYDTISGFSWGAGLPIIERVDCKGRLYWDASVKRREHVYRIVQRLRKEFHIEEVFTRITREREPSAAAIRLLKVAYEEGYFDVPKRVDLRSLSSKLGIPVATLNTALRRTLRHVVDRFVR